MSESSSNAQVLRQQAYLQAMGIDRWLPRQVLPGAAASASWVADFVWPAAAEDTLADEVFTEAPNLSPDASLMHRSAQPQARVGEVAGVVARIGSGEEARVSALASVSADAPSVERPQASNSVVALEPIAAVTTGSELTLALPPRFSLVWVSLGDLLWIDSLPQHARRGFSSAHLRLLQGLSRAMGVTEKVADATPIRHDWPAFAGSALDQSAPEALKSVRRRLERQLEFKPARGVILCGEAAAQWVLERDEGLSALRGLVFHLRPGVRALATYSLTEMLQLPEMIKPDVWKDLQALNKALHTSLRG